MFNPFALSCYNIKTSQQKWLLILCIISVQNHLFGCITGIYKSQLEHYQTYAALVTMSSGHSIQPEINQPPSSFQETNCLNGIQTSVPGLLTNKPTCTLVAAQKARTLNRGQPERQIRSVVLLVDILTSTWDPSLLSRCMLVHWLAHIVWKAGHTGHESHPVRKK